MQDSAASPNKKSDDDEPMQVDRSIVEQESLDKSINESAEQENDSQNIEMDDQVVLLL
jgi:hypothetical protein